MYESYYGFHERPFQLTPNPQWFFASKLHKRALAYLQYGLSQGEGFIVITGDVGTGKTTIANQLLARLDQQIVARQIVTSRLGPDDLLRMIASVFSLSVKDNNKTAYIEAISHYLTLLHSQNKRALLLVDEAQNLPLESIEELRMLSNFQIAGKRTECYYSVTAYGAIPAAYYCFVKFIVVVRRRLSGLHRVSD
jgi:type II secretory pathway predicted ATPase ExeA